MIELTPLPNAPLVTVIVPSYNQGKFIRATLESILEQDYRPIELLVVDGASQDDTIPILKSFDGITELKWFSEPDKGVVDAVNKGFALAKGDILAIQSSDDCYLPGAIRRAVEAFRHAPEVGLVFGDTTNIDREGRETARWRTGDYSLENLLLRKTWIPQPAAFFRRELLETVGGWNDRVPYVADLDLWIRIAFRTKVAKVDEYLSQYRVHDEQRDTQVAKIVRDYVRMIKESRDIREAPACLRRAAYAGMYSMRVRYNPHNSNLYAAWGLIRAGLVCPRCLDPVGILRFAVWQPLRRVGSRGKRAVRFLFG